MHTHAYTHIPMAIATASLVFLSRGPHRSCSPSLSGLLFQHEHRNWAGARALKIPVERVQGDADAEGISQEDHTEPRVSH